MSRLILIVSLIFAATSLNAQSLLEVNKKKINKMLGKWSEEYSDLQHFKTLDKREFYKIEFSVEKEEEEEEDYLLVISSAKGRFDFFDIMTIVKEGKIELIQIIKYRSEYGSEVSNKKWLAQFYGEKNQEFVFRKDIDAISGATFSANGLVEEMNAIIKALKGPDL